MLTSLLHLKILKQSKVKRRQSDKADVMGPALKLEQAHSEVHVLNFHSVLPTDIIYPD